ncbi:hypothetical protein TNIN_234961 [Trichonephila inaurata madagascariensis]|uniref:Uncharacterized protein n=1 Tax=Trichonephila inaurata madagascariensis TaxID=2747483 RepID=A0A8X6Y900_9ARAC|nr:hypothetical protein TNIN_234961 [Trichonephila inaurata madagascariensis]
MWWLPLGYPQRVSPWSMPHCNGVCGGKNLIVLGKFSQKDVPKESRLISKILSPIRAVQIDLSLPQRSNFSMCRWEKGTRYRLASENPFLDQDKGRVWEIL